jgi:hypothetical protein
LCDNLEASLVDNTVVLVGEACAGAFSKKNYVSIYSHDRTNEGKIIVVSGCDERGFFGRLSIFAAGT